MCRPNPAPSRCASGPGLREREVTCQPWPVWFPNAVRACACICVQRACARVRGEARKRAVLTLRFAGAEARPRGTVTVLMLGTERAFRADAGLRGAHATAPPESGRERLLHIRFRSRLGGTRSARGTGSEARGPHGPLRDCAAPARGRDFHPHRSATPSASAAPGFTSSYLQC